MKKIFSIALILFTTLASAQVNIVQRSHLTFPGKQCANIWGFTDSLGREFALVGTSTGMSICNVTNPDSAYLITNVAGINSSWREIKTWGKYAYVTTEGCCNGLQIVNLSYLPDSAPSKYFTGTGAIAAELGRTHALHIDNGFAYLYGSNKVSGGSLYGGAAVILDLTNPWNPVYVGNTQTNGIHNYIHDGYVRNDTLFGAHIYGGYFSIFDVSNKSAPQLLNTQSTPTNFTHNTWLNTSGSTLFTTDETSNSYLAAYDVSNPFDIAFRDKIQAFPGSGGIIHNVHLKNNYAIAAYYTHGVVIFDAKRPGNLCRVGNFDTSPSYSGNAFNGCWGVYPYFPSGNIVASDIEQGLYVLTPTFKRACYLEGTVKDQITNSPLPGATVTIQSIGLTELAGASGSYAMSTVTPGTYTVTVSCPGYISKTYNNIVLANGVLTKLNANLKMEDVVVHFTVLDGIGNGINLAKARLSNGNTVLSATTDSSGNGVFVNVYPGYYEFNFGKWGYNPLCMNVWIDSLNYNFNAALNTGIADDFAINNSWPVTGSAQTGTWVLDVPKATTHQGNPANPGTDVTGDCSNRCFVTGNGGGNGNFDDVDNGSTTLTSPEFDLTGYADPYIYYSRWFYAQSLSNDSLKVKLSNGIGSVTLENVNVSSIGNSTWTDHSFKVTNYITPTANMKLSLTVKDKFPGHVLEAGFDNFYVLDQAAANNTKSKSSRVILSELSCYYSQQNKLLTCNNPGFKFVKEIEVYDLAGRIVLTKNISSDQEQIQIQIDDKLDQGIYFVRMHCNDQFEVLKIVY